MMTDSDEKTLEKLIQQIDSLALEIVILDPGDIPGLGKVLNSMETLENSLKKVKDESLLSIARAMNGYIEKVILGETSDLSPFEAGISQLQEICRNLISGKEFKKDISSLLMNLGYEEKESPALPSGPGKDRGVAAGESLRGSEKADSREESEKGEGETGAVAIAEDIGIIKDFVSESLENLGTIEVKVMDLEQNPSDLETINAIFRPFHTVKGVSGFLNFNKINRLAHNVENLLDKARNGEIHIDGGIIDLILDGVDMLNRMIENVHSSLDEGALSEGDMDIEPLIARVEHLINQAEGEGQMPLGEILVKKGAVSEKDVEEALDIKKETQEKKIGEILVEQKKVAAREAVSALREQKRFAQPVALQVKVDTSKLDSMVDMVGELAIAQSMLRQNRVITASGDRNLDRIVNQLNQITSGLQRTSMSLRTVPLKNTLQKMIRLVRDLAKKAGKEVQLVMSGEDTEIDRNMVEEIYEPMVHMIRNSVDHGLELPDEREAAKKPRQGTIFIRAYHQGGDIVIEVEDDGRGLDREKILKKALSSGLIKEGDSLTDAEIYNLIFHPGFSTAEKISDISGRGVGTDVVKNTIEKLRGRVDVQSLPGKGTTFFIRLPITLAIVEGMIVKVRGERFVIPTLSVQESFRPKKTEYHTVKGDGEMIMVRDNLLPLIRLDHILGLNASQASNGSHEAAWERLVIVVENQQRRRCLLIDELLGQEEIVIKSLGEKLKDVKGLAGGAIMGDGRVGLILDIAGIFDIASGD
jgi:two-component system chemotaxis sensor kinase CheA